MDLRITSLVKVALISCVTLLGSTVAPSARASTAPGEASTSAALVADARRDVGRAVVVADGRLERIAREHSREMAGRRAIAHSAQLGSDVSAAGVNWRWVGENVGVGPDAAMIHEGFLNSPSHHEVMVKREATAFGVGAAIGEDGRAYITQVFAKIVGAARAPAVASSAPMRAAPAPSAPPSTPAATPTVEVATPDPNVVIGGIVPRTISEVARVDVSRSATRSGLPAS